MWLYTTFVLLTGVLMCYSAAVTKHWPNIIWGKKELIWLTSYSLSTKKDISGSEARIREKCSCWIASGLQVSSLYHTAQDHLPTQGWHCLHTFLHEGSVKKIPQRWSCTNQMEANPQLNFFLLRCVKLTVKLVVAFRSLKNRKQKQKKSKSSLSY